MRTPHLALLLLGVAAACGSSKQPAKAQTSGPIESIVKITKDAVRLEAVRHRVPLADLPLSSWIGLPVKGTVEIDADLTIPIVDGARDYPHAHGSLAAHCVDTCTIGDDLTKLKPPGVPEELLGDGIEFGHVDLTRLEVEVTVAGGHARLSRWRLDSPDVAIFVEGDVELTADVEQSRATGCVRYMPTPALEQRAPKAYALLALVGGTPDDAGVFGIALEGAIGTLEVMPRVCGAQAH